MGPGADHARLLMSTGARVAVGDMLDENGFQLADALGPNGTCAQFDVLELRH